MNSSSGATEPTLLLTNHALIFTDGACSGNPGPGGWGAIVVTPAGEVTELAGHNAPTTNNRMELAATIHALKKVADFPGPVLLYTDSTYVIRGITQWIWGWRKKSWVNAGGAIVQNRDLWEELDRVVKAREKSPGPEGNRKIVWKYCRGHRGVPGNERCDEIAVAMSHGRRVDLYQGPLLRYPVAIYDLPADEELPEMRPKDSKTAAKKVAHSYLSYVDGQVLRHRTWPRCEARVKGRPGAKFKKAMTVSEETEILQSWSYIGPVKDDE